MYFRKVSERSSCRFVENLQRLGEYRMVCVLVWVWGDAWNGRREGKDVLGME